MRFSLCWWNTGLAPPKGTRNEPEHLFIVADTIKMLMNQRDVDLLCLGEVDSDSLSYLGSQISDSRFVFTDRSRGDNGVKFNMGFVHRRRLLEISLSTYATANIEQKRRRMSQHVKLSLVDGSQMDLFVVHWPSRIFLPPESHTRPLIGQGLRDLVDGVLDADPAAKIIVLGDFNDEPCNDSLARYLSATRDLSMAQKFPKLLYNPFWKDLTDPEKYVRGYRGTAKTGSYYYKGDSIQKWRVFDQIVFSSSLLGSGTWHLNEEETHIWEFPDILDVGPGMSERVDHLPVFAVLEKELSYV